MQNINLGDFTLLERIMLPTVRVNDVMNTNLIVNSALQAEGRKNRAVDDGNGRREGKRPPVCSCYLIFPPPPRALNYSYFLFEVWNTERSTYGGESIINLSVVMTLKTPILHSIHYCYPIQ